MKHIFELKRPDWAKEKSFYAFYGKELYAYQVVQIQHINGKHIPVYLPLKIKTQRCNGCGDCCFECPFLGQHGCTTVTPFDCLRSVCEHLPNCTERFREVK